MLTLDAMLKPNSSVNRRRARKYISCAEISRVWTAAMPCCAQIESSKTVSESRKEALHSKRYIYISTPEGRSTLVGVFWGSTHPATTRPAESWRGAWWYCVWQLSISADTVPILLPLWGARVEKKKRGPTRYKWALDKAHSINILVNKTRNLLINKNTKHLGKQKQKNISLAETHGDSIVTPFVERG